MLLRIQTTDQGTKRLEVTASDTSAALYEKALGLFQLPSPKSYRLFKSRDQTHPVMPGKETIKTLRLSHGDMLFLFKSDGTRKKASMVEGKGEFLAPATQVNQDGSNGNVKSASDLSSVEASSMTPSFDVIEDEVDKLLAQKDGQIQRDLNPQLCRHSKSNKCVHCIPLDPWDETYLNERDPPIKFLSFHSYMRKLKSGADKGKFVFLDDINCQIVPGCTEHPPWPNGICTKCQPSAVTLSRQAYRHVDYVTFQNSSIVHNFLNFWRQSGYQRAGFLYGKYEEHTDVPLGIKAVIYCIYEPPQSCSPNNIEFLDDPDENLVDRLASSFGLVRVGWIFTDLLAEDSTKGTVKHLRGADSYFLSAEETVTAAYLQTKHPNMCKIAKNGSFGSKFVTVCATGNSENQIHFEAYQISNQGMALVRDNCLVPTHDCPELAYAVESTTEQYVPDVFYKYKDEFGNERTQLGRPLPIEYLLIDVPSGLPKDEVLFFNKHAKEPFPACNRELIGQGQDFNALCKYFSQFDASEFYKAICDFQLLVALAKLEVYPMLNHLEDLVDAIREQDKSAVEAWSLKEHWQTVYQLMQAQGHVSNGPMNDNLMDGIGGPSGSSVGVDVWSCQHCTFENIGSSSSCEMCGLPRN